MKNKSGTGIFDLGALWIAVGAAVFAQVRSGGYEGGKAEILSQTQLLMQEPDAAYSVASYPSVPADLAGGDGLQETQSSCATCHSTRYITMQPPLPAAVWEAEVAKMVKVYGAPIADASAKKIVAYLQTHYTPESRKQ